MAIVRWDPFRDLDELHKSFFGPVRSMTKPISDVYVEDDKQLVVEAQLPNFKEDEIDVNINEGVLEIRADHSEKEEENKKSRKYVVRESSSSFYRSIALPANAEEDNIEAHFEDGMLKVVVPFTPRPEPKKISIKKSASKKK